jgi:hypothetical protein
MGSTLTRHRLGSNHAMELLLHRPGTTAPCIVTQDGVKQEWRHLQGFGEFGVMAMGNLAHVEIVAAEDAGGTNTQQIASSGILPLGVAWCFLECSAVQLREIASVSGRKFLSYVAARVTVLAPGDAAAVWYGRFSPQFCQENLTPALAMQEAMAAAVAEAE